MAGDLAKGVAYIMLGVSDLDRSVTFYRDTLELPLQFQHEGLAFFSAGPVTLMLNVGAGKVRTPIAGAVELVFAVESVKAAWRNLAAKGASFFREPRQVTEKDWSAVMTDPDGHFLSVFGPEGE